MKIQIPSELAESISPQHPYPARLSGSTLTVQDVRLIMRGGVQVVLPGLGGPWVGEIEGGIRGAIAGTLTIPVAGSTDATLDELHDDPAFWPGRIIERP